MDRPLGAADRRGARGPETAAAQGPGRQGGAHQSAINRVLFGITLFFYFLATFHYLLYFINQRASIGKVSQLTTILGFGFHTVSLIYQLVDLRRVPIASIRESLVFFS